MEKIGSGKLEAALAKEAQIEAMESKVKADSVTPIPEERGDGMGTLTQVTNAPTTVNSEKKTLMLGSNARDTSDATKSVNTSNG